jgi:hypothetical protein
MSTQIRVPVLQYYEYMGRGSQTAHGTRHFCGSCRRGIGGVYGSACYGFPEYPEHIEAKNATPHGFGDLEAEKGDLEYYRFCPWCGAEFEDEWWKNRVIQNERAIDHYRNPGWHKGDTHEFRGSGPDCMAHHWLGVSGGDKLCWCDPDVEPGVLGCVIRHRDASWDDYIAAEKARREQAVAEEDDEGW